MYPVAFVLGPLESDVWLRIRRVEWTHDSFAADILIELSERGALEVWRLRAEGLLDALVHPAPTKRMVFSRRHIVIDEQIGPFGDLRFRGTAPDSAALLQDLWERHRSVAGDWLEVDHCFAARQSLPHALKVGRGLATGPLALIAAYASAMRAHGLSAVLTRRHQNKPYWLGGRWHQRRPSVSACIVGRSYFVAARFRAEMVR